MQEPAFTMGIEEEYMLVDAQSLDLVASVPDELFQACEAELHGQVSREFMQCQIEVGTGVCDSIHEARQDLMRLRKTVSDIAARHGLALLANSTHPFSAYSSQEHTRRNRYDQLASDLQEVVRRLLISGMHVHVGVGDDDLRIDMMGQATYILPHLLALSTSSPFWCGRDTGMKSYRLSVWDEMPRTGLPENFSSFAEYKRHIDVLVDVGVIEDATKIWWDLRPSDRFPTLEMRISDVCTHLDDACTIAALYQCWLRMLYRLRRGNQSWRRYQRLLINENRWRAHRYGIDEGLIDFGRQSIIPYADLFEEMLELIHEDAVALDCVAEVEHGRTILQRGTSAHQQLARYESAKAAGETDEQALKSVVAMLVENTINF